MKINRSVCLIGLVLLALMVAISSADGQECRQCEVQSISFASAPVVRTFEVQEMQTQWQQVQVPVTRKFEEVTYTREVFDGGISKLRSRRPRRLRAFNWGCVATAVGAYINCSTAKRGERIGLLRRIFNRR